MDAHATWLIQPRQFGPALVSFDGISPSAMTDYASHFHTVDVFVQVGMRRFAGTAPGPLRERDILDEAVYGRSEVYNDWLMPNGIDGFLTAALGPIVAEPPPIMTFFRPRGAEPFSDADVGHYAALLPHMRRAVRLRAAVSEGTEIGPAGVTLLERLPQAYLLLDGAGKLLHANLAARIVLDRRDGLALSDGHLAAVDRAQAPQLAEVLARCVARRPESGEMLLNGEDGNARLLVAMPLPSHAAEPFGKTLCRMCVTVMALESNAPRLAIRLMRLFGLTGAEARVAFAITKGMSPAEIAQAHGVTLPTIRTQLRSIHDKLGVRRQSELARLLTLLGEAI